MRQSISIFDKWLVKTDKVGKQLIRFAVAGLVTASLDLGLLYILIEFLSIYYLTSVAIAFLVATFVSYIFNVKWIFWDGRHCKEVEVSFFFVASWIGLALNESIIFSLVEYFQVWYVTAKIVAMGVVALGNFWCRKKLIFAY